MKINWRVYAAGVVIISVLSIISGLGAVYIIKSFGNNEAIAYRPMCPTNYVLYSNHGELKCKPFDEFMKEK